MTDTQRADFVDRGTRIYRDALGKQKKFDAQITNMVTAANLRPSQVLIDYSVEVDAPLKSRTFSFTQTDEDLAALAKEVDKNPDRFSEQYRKALEQELNSRLGAF